jgi:predicted  nucleic acid-binding Zn-ribbon protein
MKADPQAQEDLLELPVVDRKLAQLAKESSTSELKSSATQARAAVVTAEESLVETRTRIKDLEREVARAENDVQTVRTRIARDQQTLDSGAATPKQLTDIQHELESLGRRQADLEDVELEIMERMEEAAAGLTAAESLLAESRTRAEQTAAEWDRRADEIAAETVALESRRAELVGALPAELVALYEKIRDRSGVGAGLLRHGRCGACQLQLSASDLGRVREAAADDVVRCEECGAILVRTEESGL